MSHERMWMANNVQLPQTRPVQSRPDSYRELSGAIGCRWHVWPDRSVRAVLRTERSGVGVFLHSWCGTQIAYTDLMRSGVYN